MSLARNGRLPCAQRAAWKAVNKRTSPRAGWRNRAAYKTGNTGPSRHKAAGNGRTHRYLCHDGTHTVAHTRGQRVVHLA
jgi:hypothetical protein